MQSKKLLYIQNLIFNLPDDFDGTLTQALEEIVKYRKSMEAINNRSIGSIQNTDTLTLADRLTSLYNNDKDKLTLSAGMTFYNDKTGVWDYKTEKWRYK